MSAAAIKDLSSIKRVDDDIGRAFEDHDPQTLFYLNTFAVSSQGEAFRTTNCESVQTTLSSWATKIEHTVQTNLGQGSDKDRHKIQASWDRSSYRAKLIDFLAKQTPWLMMRESHEAPLSKQLNGDYYHDKKVYYQVVHDFLDEKLPEIPIEKLGFIERSITEVVVLGQNQFAKPIRFAFVLPVLLESNGVTQEAVRIGTWAFERVNNSKDLKISLTTYEGIVDKRLFGQQKFDQKMLAAGKKLVESSSLDIVI